MGIDLVIKGGTVVDGSGGVRFQADAGVREVIRHSHNADLVVFDPDTAVAEIQRIVNDLPADGTRLKQVAKGIRNTVFNGQVFLENNEHTGAHAGWLFRSGAG